MTTVICRAGLARLSFVASRLAAASPYSRQRGRTASKAFDGIRRRFSAADVLDPQSFERVASDVPDPIEGLVYAVGSIEHKSLACLADDDFVRGFRLNAARAALVVKTHLPAPRKPDRHP